MKKHKVPITDNIDSFGALFKKFRNDAGLSLDELAELTKINKQYLLYLENEEFLRLPPAVYSRGFIIRCAKIFSESSSAGRNGSGNEETRKLLHLYASKTHENREIREEITRNRAGFFGFFIGPQQFAILAVSLFFVLIVLFLGARLTPFFFQPVIEIEEPAAENTVVNVSAIQMKGKIRHVSLLTLNGETLYIGENGMFGKEVPLTEGVNRLALKAKNRFGRITEVVKRVVYVKN